MKRKYKRGKQIKSVGEFEQSNATFFRVRFGEKEKTIHYGFLESWQYHTLSLFIYRGCVFEAEANLIESKEGDKCAKNLPFVKRKTSLETRLQIP